MHRARRKEAGVCLRMTCCWAPIQLRREVLFSPLSSTKPQQQPSPSRRRRRTASLTLTATATVLALSACISTSFTSASSRCGTMGGLSAFTQGPPAPRINRRICRVVPSPLSASPLPRNDDDSKRKTTAPTSRARSGLDGVGLTREKALLGKHQKSNL